MKAENGFQLRIAGVTTIKARLGSGMFFGRLIARQRVLTPTSQPIPRASLCVRHRDDFDGCRVNAEKHDVGEALE